MYSLLKLNFKKRIKDSFLISYGIVFPLVFIGVLGYLSKYYFSGLEEINSFYYYTIVTIPYCIILSSITFTYVAREENRAGCGSRLIIAPISNKAIVISKIIPATFVIGIYNFLLLILCKLLFQVNYEGYFSKILLLVFTLGLMSVAFGTFIGLCTKKFMIIKNFISTPILILAFLGGAFFPLGKIGIVSPLYWVNRSLFLLINDGIESMYFLTLFLIILISVIFIFLSIRSMTKEALLND